jgi:diacylglycerol kinase family enzyme
MNVTVVMNRQSGSGDARQDEARQVQSALNQAGVASQLRRVPGEQLVAATRQALAAGTDVVVAAGGDGTVNAVAGVLAGTQTPLGLLPMGTLNHFAKDLGLPVDLAAAARVIASGNVRAVDVAEVNGRVFLNNSSIGLYARMVEERNRRMNRGAKATRRLRKSWAMARAFLAVFARYPTVRVGVGVGEAAEQWCTTPFVFVGNNLYPIELLVIGQRRELDAGRLCLYFARHAGRGDLLRLALRAIFGSLEPERDFISQTVERVTIDSLKRELPVAIDGEVVKMKPPLIYRVRQGALRVIAG